MASGIPSDCDEENYPTLLLDARRCIQVRFHVPVSQELLRRYFSDGNLSGGGDITWLWVCRRLALIEFESERAAKGVLNQPGHITENITFYVSEPDWIEHRTVKITGVKLSACEEILDRRGLHKFIENIQMSGDQSTMVTFTDKRVAQGLLSYSASIPEGVKVCLYDPKSVGPFPCRVLVRTKDDSSMRTVFDALRLHIECRKIDIFKDVKGGTYLMQSAKLTDRLTLERVLQQEIGNFSVSAVFVINYDQMSSSVVGEAHFEGPDLPARDIRIGRELARLGEYVQMQYDSGKNMESSAQRDRLGQEVKQLRESDARWKKAYEELMDAKTGCDGEIEKLQGKIKTLSSVKEEISNKYDELKNKYEESTAYGNRLEHEVKQITESERNLQIRLATLAGSEKEVMRQKTGLEKVVEALQQESRTSLSLKETIECQERQLVDKTQQILKLAASLISQSDQPCAHLEALQAIPGIISQLKRLQPMPEVNSQLEPLQDIPEMISQLERLQTVPEMISRLEPLQAIPGMISSQCQEIQSHITDTADKLLINVNDASSRIVDKALKNAWVSFRQDDTSDDTEASFKSTGPKNIPSRLKCHAELLSCTVGPNWLDVGRALDLDGDHLERIWADWGQYGMRELTLRVIECWCTLSPDPQISLDVLKSAMSRLEINPLMVEPMDENDRRILTENFTLLAEDMMDVTHIESYLRQAKILSASAVEYIIYPRTRHDRILRLLKVLPFSGCRALGEFITALRESGQTHIALALAGERSLPTDTERDVTQDVLVRCLETKKREDRTHSEQLTTITRACAEIKQGIYMHHEELEKRVFLSRKAKCENCSSLLGDITSDETAVKEAE